MSPQPHPSARTRRALAAVATAVAGLLLLAVPAGAHGGPGRLELVSATRSGAAVDLDVRLTYIDDGHGVPDATVTAVVEGATPTTLQPGAEEGTYRGTVEAPAGAVIRITSVEPSVTLEVDAPADDGPTTTEATTTSEAPTTTGVGTSTTTEAGSTDADGATTTTDDDDDDGDDDSSLLPVVAGVAAVAVVGVVAALVLLRRPAAGDGGDPDADATRRPDGP